MPLLPKGFVSRWFWWEQNKWLKMTKVTIWNPDFEDFSVHKYLLRLGKLSQDKICFYLDIVKIALTPPLPFWTPTGNFAAKRCNFFSSAFLNNLDLGLTPTFPFGQCPNRSRFFLGISSLSVPEEFTQAIFLIPLKKCLLGWLVEWWSRLWTADPFSWLLFSYSTGTKILI